MATRCVCDWCKVVKKTGFDLRKYIGELYMNDFIRKEFEYDDLILFTIAKYGEEYFDKLNAKWDGYCQSILDDAPYPFSIFDDDIAKGCFMAKLLGIRYFEFNINFVKNMVNYKLSIPTINHILETNNISIYKLLDGFKFFKICVNNKCMYYFKTIAMEHEQCVVKNIWFENGYAEYLLTLNSDEQLNPEIYEVLSDILGVDNVISDISNARNHGQFKKTDIVISNYKKIMDILDNIE